MLFIYRPLGEKLGTHRLFFCKVNHNCGGFP